MKKQRQGVQALVLREARREAEIRNAFAGFSIERLDEVAIHEVHQDGNEHFHREWLMVAEKIPGYME